jgi:osmotically inducible protein OsmC
MTDTLKVLFTAKVHTTGGRDGGCSCFEGAIGIAARKLNISTPAGMAIDAEVELCLSNDAYFVRCRPNASLQGLQPDVARELIEPGHRTWSYSKATRGNIDVLTNLIKAEGA